MSGLFEWLAEVFVISPNEKELGMPDIPWLSADEGILRLRENVMQDWEHLCKT